MNAANVSRVLSLIPDRVVRAPSGCAFDPSNVVACAFPERITHLAQFLNWLGPLQPLTKEDLRLFGLMTPYGRPAIEAGGEDALDAADADADTDAELDAEVELSAPVILEAPAQEPALT